jgi:hypothetical protein
MARPEQIAVSNAEAAELEARISMLAELGRLRSRDYDTTRADDLLNEWSARRAELLAAVAAMRAAAKTPKDD